MTGRARVATCRGVSALPALHGVSTALHGVSTLGGVSALRFVSTLRGVPALRCVSTLRRVSTLGCVPAALGGVSTLRPVPAALRCVSASAAFCRGRVGRGLAGTGFVLLLLRRSASRSNCGHGEKNQQ